MTRARQGATTILLGLGLLSLNGCEPGAAGAMDLLMVIFGGVERTSGPGRFFLSTAPPLAMGDGSVSIRSSASSGSRSSQASNGSEAVVFNGFVQDSGTFTIDYDFKGDPDFTFPVTGEGDLGCIDFASNGCGPTDVRIEYLPGENRFHIDSPYSAALTLKSGAYAFFLEPGIIELGTGPGDRVDLVLDATAAGGEPIQLVSPFVPGLVGFLTTIPVGEAGGLRIAPSVVVGNPTNSTASVQLEFFNADSGISESLSLNGAAASPRHLIELPPRSTRRFEISSPGDGLTTAWGTVSSDTRSVTASVIFPTYDIGDDSLVAEAGVATVPAAFQHVLDLKKTEEGVDTAMAILNPTDTDATVDLRLTDRSDREVGHEVFIVPAGSRSARFFAELLDLDVTGFEGTLQISSDVATAINTLQTLDGLQTSSLEASPLR